GIGREKPLKRPARLNTSLRRAKAPVLMRTRATMLAKAPVLMKIYRRAGELFGLSLGGRFAMITLLVGWFSSWHVQANPVGPTVTQGKASFSSQGPQLTIQTSDRAFINWQSFNIGVGQTTTFIQPSSSSLVWNQINDSNPSQILGNLNAN